MEDDYNERYYIFIMKEIKDLRYAYSSLYEDLLSIASHWGINENLDKKEFYNAFIWATADHFNDGCDVESI